VTLALDGNRRGADAFGATLARAVGKKAVRRVIQTLDKRIDAFTGAKEMNMEQRTPAETGERFYREI
jgi:hypothetical protein